MKNELKRIVKVQKEFVKDVQALKRLLAKMKTYSSAESVLGSISVIHGEVGYIEERINDDFIETINNAKQEARS